MEEIKEVLENIEEYLVSISESLERIAQSLEDFIYEPEPDEPTEEPVIVEDKIKYLKVVN